MYVKDRTKRTIEVAEATVMPSRILHGRPVLAECAVVEVTMIREGHEFKDLDYLDEDQGIEKLVDAKGTFILWPHKDIIVKICSSPIVSSPSTGAGALLLQICRSLLKSLIHQQLLLSHKTLKTQSSRRARREGRILQRKSLKAQSSRASRSVHFLLLLDTKSSRATRSFLLLLETKSSWATRCLHHLLLLLKS
jgi:hypothetical protein